ncbi:S9 family peptidase [Undibacterium cyanobacteriorum]|uniref:S9 family peptidase n=1 Tax=Undibacterium cyanobacteriorum TaxID=3073561 RepID=A0ABY9RKQ0_9BURK|nr:S9 family peptidase [Undibacterium sp. 20NA77.5]WMW81802.1 S9 family peptidase [Undibacterium sp. 20NA77.5]
MTRIGVSWIIAAVILQSGFMMQTQAQTAAAASSKLSLEKIMSNTDWMGNAPERSYFSADGKTVYFVRKADGSEVRDVYRVPVNGGVPTKLNAAELAVAESESRFVSPDRSQVAWIRNGNLFLLKDGKKTQMTRTGDVAGLLGFISNEQLAFRQDGKINSFNLRTGETNTLVNLKNEDDPAAKKEAADYLSLQQTRLFDIIKKRDTDKKDAEKRQRDIAQQASSAPQPIYLGKGREFRQISLSPDGKYLVVSTATPRKPGRSDKMPHYVSADGYVMVQDVRSKVGTGEDANEFVYVIDISANQAHKLKFDQLAGINEDPLLSLKIDAAKRLGKPEPKAAVPRAIYLGFRGTQWADNGQKVALQLFSADNKDRWIIELNTTSKDKAQWQLVHRLTDQAWVNDNDFNEMLYSRDGKTLWYLSEESGFSQLYHYRDGQSQAVTKGKYEMSRITLTRDGRWIYYRANKKHPGKYEVYRIGTDGQNDQALTDMNGGMDYELSPNEDRLLLTHSTITRQPDLFVQAAAPMAKATRLTDSTSKEFADINWIVPDVVAVPSKHGAAPIYSRVYQDKSKLSGPRRPAVMFVHGAGYLQAAHYGWSNYFREMMFHNLLVQEGYVVIDMDYRASAGYGRDWRNAIYQRMGTPELEDYLDGIDWLVENANVDRQRVGIYGGSYGGFMTFMAMFKTEAFAAGAALRPVADWAHYNHGYTSNILNTPDVDPEAYLRSSPIEFAAGLKRPLLICSGVLDDNVFFQDSVRMVQKLIELKNPNFEFAVYPIEAHGFREPTSWLDEYRRIFKLMEREVKGRELSSK